MRRRSAFLRGVVAGWKDDGYWERFRDLLRLQAQEQVGEPLTKINPALRFQHRCDLGEQAEKEADGDAVSVEVVTRYEFLQHGGRGVEVTVEGSSDGSLARPSSVLIRVTSHCEEATRDPLQ